MTIEQVVLMLDALAFIVNVAPSGLTLEQALALTKYTAIEEWGYD